MASTINAYSVSLGLDASSYIRNSKLSRSETNALRRDINQARTPAEKYEHTINRLDKALAAGAISQRTYNRMVAEAKRKHDAASRSAKMHSGALGGLRTQLAGAAAAYISLSAATQAGTWAVKLAADAEQAQIAFEVLTKDAEVAENLINKLRGFAASTPFRKMDIINSGRNLLAFGFAANEVAGRLEMMGNISAATGTNINELSQIIGKMRVQGVIMSEDLNQLTGRGINVIDGLSDRLGVLPSQLKKAASEGKIAFEDLLAVLEQLSKNEFGGMTEKLAESTAGKISTLKDSIDELGESVGNLAVEGGLNDFLGMLTKQANQAGKGIQFLKDIYSGNDPRQRQLEAEAELFESEQLLRDLRAGRDTPRVREIRQGGAAQIIEKKTEEENAFREANREMLQERMRQDKARNEELFKRLGLQTKRQKEEEQLKELRKMRAEWAKIQESQTAQIVTAIAENAFRRIR